jgi:1-hydroxycarotenoid 3,4-desaturase
MSLKSDTKNRQVNGLNGIARGDTQMSGRAERRVVIIGAGVAGLVSAALLSAKGVAVTVVEKAAAPGGKMREVTAGGRAMDAGPTVFTMRPVFEEIFAAAGARLEDHLTLDRPEILARHAWTDGSALDLFADQERNVDAISVFAGAREGQRYRRFAARAKRLHDRLAGPFLNASRTNPFGMAC